MLTTRSGGAIGNSFVWTGVPYPLHWIPSGLYQLELRPMTWTAPDGPLLARSPFFNISDPVSPIGPYDPPPQVSLSPMAIRAGVDGATLAQTRKGWRGPANTGDIQQPPLGDYQGKDASGMSKELAIGLGVAIGVPSIAALGAMSWCVRKRRGRAATEKRRLKRSEFVID